MYLSSSAVVTFYPLLLLLLLLRLLLLHFLLLPALLQQVFTSAYILATPFAYVCMHVTTATMTTTTTRLILGKLLNPANSKSVASLSSKQTYLFIFQWHTLTPHGHNNHNNNNNKATAAKNKCQSCYGTHSAVITLPCIFPPAAKSIVKASLLLLRTASDFFFRFKDSTYVCLKRLQHARYFIDTAQHLHAQCRAVIYEGKQKKKKKTFKHWNRF